MCGEKHDTKLHKEKPTPVFNASSSSKKETKVMYTPMSSHNSSTQTKKRFNRDPLSQFKDLMVILLRQEFFWILVQKIRLFLSILHKY